MNRPLIKLSISLVMAALVSACGADEGPGQTEDNFTELDPEAGLEHGAPDEGEPRDLEGGGNKSTAYLLPTDLPALSHPEIIVSLSPPLVVHLFDRETGNSFVYPTGVGRKNSQGFSFTQSGHFSVGTTNHNDRWYWVQRRNDPEYYDGLPFLRLSMENYKGWQTYGMHGPVTSELQRGYVSSGCMRMKPDDIVDLFWMLYNRRVADPDASATPISTVLGQALDANGQVLDVGSEAAIWDVGESIDWAAMDAEQRPTELDPVRGD